MQANASSAVVAGNVTRGNVDAVIFSVEVCGICMECVRLHVGYVSRRSEALCIDEP